MILFITTLTKLRMIKDNVSFLKSIVKLVIDNEYLDLEEFDLP